MADVLPIGIDSTTGEKTVMQSGDTIPGIVPTSYLDTDGTLAANSDTKIATQKAVKTYVDTNAGGADYIGYVTHGGYF